MHGAYIIIVFSARIHRKDLKAVELISLFGESQPVHYDMNFIRMLD